MLLARMTWLLEQRISLQSRQLVCWCLKKVHVENLVLLENKYGLPAVLFL